LQDLFSAARTSILTLASDEGRYIQFLEGIIVQGLLQLLEPNVTVYSRKKDTETSKQAASAAVKQYKDISGRDVIVDVEGSLNNDGYVSVPTHSS